MDLDQLASIFEAVKVLPLRPTDRLLVRCRGRISEMEIKAMREAFEREFPGHRVLVLDNGADLEVIREESDAS
jgi:hypothetical protein